MEAYGLIENYNNEIKPLMRSKIVDYLTEIFDKRFNLNETDREFLNYFIDEFYFDLTGRLDKYEILFGSEKYSPLSNKEKFTYAYADNLFSLFVKSHLNFSSISPKEQKISSII